MEIMQALAFRDESFTTEFLLLGFLIGLGFVLGTAAPSAIVGWPVLQAPKIANGLHAAMQMSLAALVVAIGISIMSETGPLAWVAS